MTALIVFLICYAAVTALGVLLVQEANAKIRKARAKLRVAVTNAADQAPAAGADGYPVETDCQSCHGTGINDSVLPSLFHPDPTDRLCRDCDGTGIAVVWS